MHRLVISDGIVLRKRGVGEANMLAVILTEKLGRVSVAARSSRLVKSKLRYGLEPLTHARFSMVRGKYEWKLTGVVEPVRRPGADAPAFVRASAGRICKLLLRLVHGEEAEPQLYRCVAEGFEALAGARTAEEADSVEAVLVLRVLHRLGYVPESAELAAFVAEPLHTELLARAAEVRPVLIRAINASLEATGM